MFQKLCEYENRAIWLATADMVPNVHAWPVETPFFQLIVFGDESETAAIARFAARSLDAGARYVMCAGEWAEHWELVFDGVITEPGRYTGRDEDHIGTTGHADESPIDVLWQAFRGAAWAEGFLDCGPAVVLAMADQDPRISALKEACSNLVEVFQDLVDKEAGWGEVPAR